MTDDDFLVAFEDCSFPRSDWTHTAHFRMAWLYLSREASEAAALTKVCEGIKRFNKEAGGPPGKYSETVTRAYVRIVADRIAPHGGPETCSQFLARNADLTEAYPGPLSIHYSEELLFSRRAHDEFVEPDRAPLPEATIGNHG